MSECGSDPDTCVTVTPARPPANTARWIPQMGSLKQQEEEEPDRTGAVSLSDATVDAIAACRVESITTSVIKVDQQSVVLMIQRNPSSIIVYQFISSAFNWCVDVSPKQQKTDGRTDRQTYLSLHCCLCCCLSVRAESSVSAISLLPSPARPSSSTVARNSIVWRGREEGGGGGRGVSDGVS